MDGRLKGQLGEAIAEYLFRASDIRVFRLQSQEERDRFLNYLRRCGGQQHWIEHFERNISMLGRPPIPDLAIAIRGAPTLLEVKYRRSVRSRRELDRLYSEFEKIIRFWGCAVLLVTREPFPKTGHFTAISGPAYVSAGERWPIKDLVAARCEEYVKHVFELG